MISEQTVVDNKTDLSLKPILFDVIEAIANSQMKYKRNKTNFKDIFSGLDEEVQHNINVIQPNIDEGMPTIKNSNSILLNFLEVNLGVSPQNITYTSQSQILSFVSKQLNEMVDATNFSSEYFGPEITLNKRVLLLWPILLYDGNDEQQLASVSLEFYRYGMAILKISYPIVNQTSQPLMTNEYDLYHKSCYYNLNTNEKVAIEDFDYKEVENNLIDGVIDTILNWLDTNSNEIIHSEYRQIIQLNKLKSRNINLRQPKREEIEAIFRIVNAPVVDGTKFHTERNKLWNEQYWGTDKVRYFFSSMGRCLAIANFDRDDFITDEITEDEVNIFMRRALLSNVEDAYKVMLLNRLNSVNYLLKQNEADYQELKNFEEDYYYSENYILGLLDFSFGTVRELYSTIERVCSQYLNKESLEKRFNNNRIVLSNKNQKRVNKENDRLSVLGILITILVSFPAIYETLTIFQKGLIINDIPYISVFGLSVTFEVVLIVSLIYWYRNLNK